MTSGYVRVYDGEMYRASLATISRALGPGKSVLISGSLAVFSSIVPCIHLYLKYLSTNRSHFSFVNGIFGERRRRRRSPKASHAQDRLDLVGKEVFTREERDLLADQEKPIIHIIFSCAS